MLPDLFLDQGQLFAGDGRLVPYPTLPAEAKRASLLRSRWAQQTFSVCVAVGLLLFAVYALSLALAGVGTNAVLAALTEVPVLAIAASLFLTAMSYVALTGYDWLALRHLEYEIPYRRVALGSFLSYAFANNLGLALLTGGTVRYRVYAGNGVTAADVAVLTAICGLTFTLSACLMVALALALSPATSAAVLHLPEVVCWGLGWIMLLGLAAYLAWVGSARRSMTYRNFEVALPGVLSTLGQFLVGAADMICAAGALYILLPDSAGIGFMAFVSVFAAAIALGLISNVPGGVGVFETVILIAVPGASAPELIASLLLYRCIYYLLPFVTALVLLAHHEARRLLAMRGLWEAIERTRSLAGTLTDDLGRRWAKARRELIDFSVRWQSRFEHQR